MSQTDTTTRPVAAGADHMQNTIPAGKPYTTATPDTFGQSQAAAGGSVNKSTQNKPKVIKLLARTTWAPMTQKEKRKGLWICEEFSELTSDEEALEVEMEAWMGMC